MCTGIGDSFSSLVIFLKFFTWRGHNDHFDYSAMWHLCFLNHCYCWAFFYSEVDMGSVTCAMILVYAVISKMEQVLINISADLEELADSEELKMSLTSSIRSETHTSCFDLITSDYQHRLANS